MCTANVQCILEFQSVVLLQQLLLSIRVSHSRNQYLNNSLIEGCLIRKLALHGFGFATHIELIHALSICLYESLEFQAVYAEVFLGLYLLGKLTPNVLRVFKFVLSQAPSVEHAKALYA